MILLIMLFTLISIGLLGILVVVTYACVTTQSLRNLCSSLVRRREPTKIRYAVDQDYANRVVEDVESQQFDKSFEGSSVNLSAVSASSSEDEADAAIIQDVHYHPPGVACDCTDLDDDSEAGFDSSSPASQVRQQQQQHQQMKETVKFNGPYVGVIV